MNGQIFIEGEISEGTYEKVKDEIARNRAAEALTVHIASPGGSVYEGWKIYHALKATGKKIHCVIEGEAQSMATYISLAGDSIEIKDPSVYMIHNPSQGVKGDAAQLGTAKEELQMIEDEMAKAYSLKTKLPETTIREMMKKTTILSANEAKQYGFVDNVTNYLRAVALGKTPSKAPIMENTLLSEIKAGIEKLTKDLAGIPVQAPIVPAPAIPAQPANPAPAQTPRAAVDIPLQDGTSLSVDAPDQNSIMGAPATFNGAPAEGDYTAMNGDVITCNAGMVTAIVTAGQQMAALKAQIAALTPKVVEADNQVKVIKEANEKVVALASQVTELKSKTVGTENRPFEGLANPTSAGPTAEGQRTASFLAEFMPWLEQYNVPRGNQPALMNKIERRGPQALNSILETNFNYTYPGILTTDIVFKPTLDTPAISDFCVVDQGIQFRKKYNLVTQLSNLLQPYGGCTRIFNNNRQLVTSATVEVKEFQVSESWCKDDFTAQLTGVYNNLAQEWLKTGNRSFDPSGTPISSVIDQIMSDALRRDVFQRFSFGAGNSSSTNYNQIDGLWDRLIDSSGASNYCVVRGGSALGVGTLGAGAALTALEAVFAASNPLLKQMIGKTKFYVTGSVYDNYVQSLVGTGSVSVNQFQNTIDGVGGSLNQTVGGGVHYKGIPVIPVRFWDSSLADTNNPLNATTRHLILLTVKENHIFGIENGPDLNKIEGWYERKDRKFYYESDMKFGYNYLHCDLQSIAF